MNKITSRLWGVASYLAADDRRAAMRECVALFEALMDNQTDTPLASTVELERGIAIELSK